MLNLMYRHSVRRVRCWWQRHALSPICIAEARFECERRSKHRLAEYMVLGASTTLPWDWHITRRAVVIQVDVSYGIKPRRIDARERIVTEIVADSGPVRCTRDPSTSPYRRALQAAVAQARRLNVA